jgi:hypothetical protein
LDSLDDAAIARLRTGIDVMEDLLRRAAGPRAD